MTISFIAISASMQSYPHLQILHRVAVRGPTPPDIRGLARVNNENKSGFVRDEQKSAESNNTMPLRIIPHRLCIRVESIL